MGAESGPRERMPSGMGTVQTAQRIGPGFGPVIGGLLAGLVGLRRAFLVTAAFYGIALVAHLGVAALIFRDLITNGLPRVILSGRGANVGAYLSPAAVVLVTVLALLYFVHHFVYQFRVWNPRHMWKRDFRDLMATFRRA
mgnify:CR=1 FL=1